MLVVPKCGDETDIIVKATKSIKYLHPRETMGFISDNDDPFNSSSWQWGRWILFVLFLVGFLAFLIFTITTNRRRRAMGQSPIRGTAWMTPPSYRQSEQQYIGNSQRVVDDYVPEYSAQTNNNDLGYYDQRGEFHRNSKSEYMPPPDLNADLNNDPNLSRPLPAQMRDDTNNSHIEREMVRPTYTPGNYYSLYPHEITPTTANNTNAGIDTENNTSNSNNTTNNNNTHANGSNEPDVVYDFEHENEPNLYRENKGHSSKAQ